MNFYHRLSSFSVIALLGATAQLASTGVQAASTYEYHRGAPGLAVSGQAVTPTPKPAAPVLSLSTSSLAFGATEVGVPAAGKTVQVSNTGTAILTLPSPPYVSGPGFDVSSNCGSSLEPGASCLVNVGFTPSSVGTVSGDLTVVATTGSSVAVGLSGTGTLPTDSSYSAVSNLLHFDGLAGQTTFPDQKGNVVTRVGAVVLSTSQAKFGGASVYFNGNSYLTVPTADLSRSDWTVEAWVYSSVSGVQQTLISFNAGSYAGINIWRNPSNQLVVDNGVNAQAAFLSNVPTNSWFHLAVVRKGTSTTAYLNGAAVGTNTFVPITTSLMMVGRYNNGASYFHNGFIDELRVTPGLARYTGNFTVPSAAYPNQ